MKYYISGFNEPIFIDLVLENVGYLNYILFTFLDLQNPKFNEHYLKILKNCKEILIDSGAFSLQRNKHNDYDKYVKDYCNFISNYDNSKISGFFEMDIDFIVGYDIVLEYRKQIEEVTDKVIPVWHINRGISEFKNLCENYNYISVTNKSADIKRKQLKLFVDYAHKHNTRIHGLGVSGKSICEKIPFDSVDSTNYLNSVKYNSLGLNSEYLTKNYQKVRLLTFIKEMKLGEYYYDKWKKVCKWEE